MNYSTIRPALLFVAAAFIYGCLPAPYIYHEPSASGGELIHSFCHQFAPKDTIELQFEGVQIQVSGQDNWLSLTIYVPEEKEAQFVSDHIELYIDKPENAKAYKITHSVYYDTQSSKYITIDPTTLMMGCTKSETRCGFGQTRLYEMSAQLDEEKKEHFFIRLSGLLIDGKHFELPIIEFTKKSGVAIMSVNC